ncbi:MAG: HU family DNA-binding protein [Prevotellaceae bacterium]|nr:HU family DNA-binding protein [Candidatus Minthosoma equi]
MAFVIRKIKKILGFQEGKPTVYKAQQVIFPEVTYKQLVDECSNSCGVNPSQTQAVVTALIDRLVHYMEIGHPVSLGDFGSFRPQINAKCVKTAEEVTAETVVNKKIRFVPGKQFRTMIAEQKLEQASEGLND